MLKIQQDLMTGLAAALETISPGAGAKAAFESPKVAAHGDLAVTAAMQLAKPLKLNPRQVGEQLRAALLAQPVYRQWARESPSAQRLTQAVKAAALARLPPLLDRRHTPAASHARFWLTTDSLVSAPF